MAVLAAALLGGPAGAAAAAAAAGPEQRLADLRSFLSRKEGELAQLTTLHDRQLKEADALAREVEAQKEKPDRNWFEQRAVEKNLARLRAELQEIERGAVRERAVKEEAFAAAAAVVSELESLLDADLGRLRDRTDPGAREKLLERVQATEKERRAAQRKMNDLTPSIPLPADLPPNVPWTREMIEDQKRACEAVLARLGAERDSLRDEERLRDRFAEAVAGATTAEDSGRRQRVEARLAEVERDLARFKAKYDRLTEAPAPSGTRP